MSLDPLEYGLLSATDGYRRMRGLFSEAAIVEAHLRVEAALALAQAEVGLVPAEAATTIAAACRLEVLDLDRLRREAGHVGYPIVPLVAQLAAASGEAGRFVHWGATTQDVMDTALVLLAREAYVHVLDRLDAVRASLRDLALRHATTPMAGRSKLQHAAPISFGYKVAVWLSMLDRQAVRLAAARDGLLVVQLGGAVGTLAAMGPQGLAVRAAVARELGLAEPTITWHTARDALSESVSALALVNACLAKIALDIATLMATEIAELREPYAPRRGSSSTMPQKRNPVLSEAILAAAKAAREGAGLMLDAVVQDHERATSVAQLEQHVLARGFLLCAGALDCAGVIAEGLEVDEPAMRANLSAGGGAIMAEAAMMRLAPVLGRDRAHQVVARACRLAEQERRDLLDVLGDDPEVAPIASRAALEASCDPRAYLGHASAMVNAVVSAHRRRSSIDGDGPAA